MVIHGGTGSLDYYSSYEQYRYVFALIEARALYLLQGSFTPSPTRNPTLTYCGNLGGAFE